jgi:hypothetical protein
MRRRTVGVVVAGALGVAGCGGGSTPASRPRPPAPINLSVYVDSARVTVSPRSIGAGPVVLIVTNQARRPVSLIVAPAPGGAQLAPGGAQLATTGPISPQATARVKVDLSSPGVYTIATASSGRTEAALATRSPIRGALLHVGAQRPSASSALLQP